MTRRSCAQVLLFVPVTSILSSFHGFPHSHQLCSVTLPLPWKQNISHRDLGYLSSCNSRLWARWVRSYSWIPGGCWRLSRPVLGHCQSLWVGTVLISQGIKQPFWDLLSVVFATVPPFVLSSMWYLIAVKPLDRLCAFISLIANVSFILQCPNITLGG